MLLEKLKGVNKLSTHEASELLNISESSTRRLFTMLEEDGMITKVYGGIRLNGQNKGPDYSFDTSAKSNPAEKLSIAKKACELVEDFDVLYLDTGTTIYQTALELRSMLEEGMLKNIRIITNSLANLEILNDRCQIILIGGEYNHTRKDFSGHFSELFVKQFNYNKAFLGADGFDTKNGFMAFDEGIAKLNELAIENSEKVYVALDSTKIGKSSFVKYAGTGDVDAMITDCNISRGQLSDCEAAGLNVLVSGK